MKRDKDNTVAAESTESRTDNLTGGQIQEVLDTLIHQSIAPVVRSSDAFDLQVVYILSSTARNRKRKLSSLPRDEAIDKMCQFLSSQDREEKVALVGKMRLERGFIYNFVVRFLREVDGYPDLYHQMLCHQLPKEREDIEKKMSMIENSVGCDRSSLLMSSLAARDYLELAYEFRNAIVTQYIKHAYKQAKGFVKLKGKNFDFEDVKQNFLTAITKAVDKYDASKGALTSYINWWLLNAQTTNNSNHGHEYGVAYSIPQLQKKALAEKSTKAKNVNYGISLEKMVGSEGEQTELGQYIAGDESVERELLDTEEIDNIRALAKTADIKGIARLYLDIDEVFSKKEERRMLKNMRRQLGVVPKKNAEGRVEFVPYTPPKRTKNKKVKQKGKPTPKTS
jgi:hypothetical protein